MRSGSIRYCTARSSPRTERPIAIRLPARRWRKSNTGWTEATPYSGNRPAWTNNGAASGGATSNSSSKASFSITGTATVAGAFLCAANSGSGVIYGEALFTGGDRAVQNLDTLSVECDLSVS